MATLAEGTLLWRPPEALQRGSELQRYIDWLAHQKGLVFDDYAALWQWSVESIEDFWESIWQFFDIHASQPYEAVLPARVMPGARWFPAATLNYAEHVFRHATEAHPAVIAQAEGQLPVELSWAELQGQVAAAAAGLRALGVGRGDRVVAYLPNIPQALVAFLACASLGAIWSSCSPDMGDASVTDRFKQIAPKVLFAVDGYRYGGKTFDRRAAVAALRQALPSLEHTVLVPYLQKAAAPEPVVTHWAAFLAGNRAGSPPPTLTFEQVPFDHPLWVLYSSGTTGLPKPIVQSQGGILIEHLKKLSLHMNLGPGKRFFWFTTTGWMMWNLLIGGLLVGATVLLYDGSPAYPDLGALWQFAEQSGMTYLGASAAYLLACQKAGLTPGASFDLRRLSAIGSTGSPLPVEGFAWVYQQVRPDIWLASVSGGTDVCTAFVAGAPLLPVYAGEIQCRCLGCKVAAFDPDGQPVIGEVGELVLTEPIPSMPIFFWNDSDGKRYHESYFDVFPGVWRHGDWCKITERGSVVIYGRSDSTINRQGIRMGTSEMYRVVEELPEVQDSLVIDLEGLGGAAYMALFVVLRPGVTLDETLVATIKGRIRSALSPRHVPDEILAIAEVPRTLNNKKLEVPIKKILLGTPAAQAANPDAMANPSSLAPFVELAARLRGMTR